MPGKISKFRFGRRRIRATRQEYGFDSARRRALAIMVLCIATALALERESWGQSSRGEGEVFADLDRLMQSYADERGFTGVVFIAQNEEIAFDKAYGYANEEHGVLW